MVINKNTEKQLSMIRQLDEIAAGRGQSLAQMALSWVLREGKVSSVLVGASKISQLEDNIQCLRNLEFTAEELNAIDREVNA